MKTQLAVVRGGLPISLKLSEDQKHYITHAPSLIKHLKQVYTMIADKGYDSDTFVNLSQPKTGHQLSQSATLKYASVEGRLVLIAISTRYDKLPRNYSSMVSLAFTLMWLPIHC